MIGLSPVVATGLTLGLVYAALPGAVNAEAARRAVRQGFAAGLLVEYGSLLGDVLWAVIGLSGAAVLVKHDGVAIALGLIGTGFLFSLARAAFRAALSEVTATGEAHRGNAFRVGVTFSLANPAGIAFWSGLGAGMLGTTAHQSWTTLAALLLAFLVGAAIWGLVWAALIAWGGRFAGARVQRWIDGVCGTALSYFGLRLLWTTLQRASRWLVPFVRAVA